MKEKNAQLRSLPALDKLLLTKHGLDLTNQFGRPLAVEAMRQATTRRRTQLLQGESGGSHQEIILADASSWLATLIAPTLRSAINATGVIIHTNLGRAPLSAAAIKAIQQIGGGYSNLEYDQHAGKRGSRAIHAESALKRLTGAGAAFVANNNAAAVLLALTALCQGKEAIISRGQLVEIGGGFRVPDVIIQSGCRLVEVGTTNRTRLADYEAAINENSGAILVAHHSNYKIIGFTAEPSLAELAALAKKHELPLIFDQGSGALLDTGQFGLERETTAMEALEAGVDLIAFSGDKLLGGPQAGILAGKEKLVDRCRRHPLARAVRPDKLCLAALSATLTPYLTGQAVAEIPIWQMIARSPDEIAKQAAQWAAKFQEQGLPASTREGVSTVGGGSLPGSTLPTQLTIISDGQPNYWAQQLRLNDPPIIARIQDDALALDPRTVLPQQEAALLAAVCQSPPQEESP